MLQLRRKHHSYDNEGRGLTSGHGRTRPPYNTCAQIQFTSPAGWPRAEVSGQLRTHSCLLSKGGWVTAFKNTELGCI